jgi:uncharacterized FlaG/YvyC family protein
VDERKDPMSEFSVYSVDKSSGENPVSHMQPVESQHSQKPTQEVKSTVPMYTFPGNTRLIYKVDETNHEIIVMVVDEASSKIIRTVPDDAMKDSQSGDLIQKSA